MIIWVPMALISAVPELMSARRLGDLYEWVMKKRKRFRRLHVFFAMIFIVEIILGCYLGYRQKNENVATVIGGFGSLLLTTALVYSNLSKSPSLRFLGISIEPSQRDLLDDEYKTTLYVPNVATGRWPSRITLVQANAKNLRRFPRIVREIRCKAAPTQLRVADDLTNIGSEPTSIHEYNVEEKPGPRSLYVKRDTIGPQQRVTLDHTFPRDEKLHKGFCQLKITAIAATQELSTSCWIWISPNGETIRWCSEKKPLEKCALKDQEKA
jgi:hypothetical protein